MFVCLFVLKNPPSEVNDAYPKLSKCLPCLPPFFLRVLVLISGEWSSRLTCLPGAAADVLQEITVICLGKLHNIVSLQQGWRKRQIMKRVIQ